MFTIRRDNWQAIKTFVLALNSSYTERNSIAKLLLSLSSTQSIKRELILIFSWVVPVDAAHWQALVNYD